MGSGEGMGRHDPERRPRDARSLLGLGTQLRKQIGPDRGELERDHADPLFVLEHQGTDRKRMTDSIEPVEGQDACELHVCFASTCPAGRFRYMLHGACPF